MSRRFVLVVMLAVAGVACGCSQLGPQYYKPSQDYSFHPPADWRYNAPEEEVTIFYSHHVKSYDFRPNVKIAVEDTELVLEEYVENQRRERLPKLSGFKMIEEGYVRYGEVWRAVYNYYDPQYKTTIRSLLQLALHDTKIYTITYMAPRKIWRRYAGMFYDSLATFKFGEDAVPIGLEKGSYDKPELNRP